jgi:phosphoribosylformimino-5-aminoimidazole carboxamide ribonucleotide (ProFAR) isomerase
MGGIPLPVVRRLRAATSRRLFAAGGVTTRREIALLEAIDVDAVVGMAIYTSTLDGDPV